METEIRLPKPVEEYENQVELFDALDAAGCTKTQVVMSIIDEWNAFQVVRKIASAIEQLISKERRKTKSDIYRALRLDNHDKETVAKAYELLVKEKVIVEVKMSQGRRGRKGALIVWVDDSPTQPLEVDPLEAAIAAKEASEQESKAPETPIDLNAGKSSRLSLQGQSVGDAGCLNEPIEQELNF